MNAAPILNRAIGWSSCTFGIAIGLVLGLWSFDGPVQAPALLADYGATPRRLVRLAHIAWIALGMLNVLFALEAPHLRLRPAGLRAASRALAFGNLALPVVLTLAALWPPAKYLLGPPALCVLLGLGLVAFGTLKPAHTTAQAPGAAHGLDPQVR